MRITDEDRMINDRTLEDRLPVDVGRGDSVIFESVENESSLSNRVYPSLCSDEEEEALVVITTALVKRNRRLLSLRRCFNLFQLLSIFTSRSQT